MGRLVKLQGLRLNDNRLSGMIPPELGNLTRLLILSLGGNRVHWMRPPGLAGRMAERPIPSRPAVLLVRWRVARGASFASLA